MLIPVLLLLLLQASLAELHGSLGHHDDLDNHGFDESLEHRLRWAGHHIYLPECFEEGVGRKFVDKGWCVCVCVCVCV